MPKRTGEQLAERRQHILDAALRCFAREGFHVTSMSDVIAEAGVSAGSVYRYFDSKESLIQAAAGDVFATVRLVLTELAEGAELVAPLTAVQQILDTVLGGAAERGVDLTRVAPMVWAEALRNEEMGDFVRSSYTDVRTVLTHVVERWRDAGRLDADLDATAAAGVLFSTVPGYFVQLHLMGGADREAYGAGLAALMPALV